MIQIGYIQDKRKLRMCLFYTIIHPVSIIYKSGSRLRESISFQGHSVSDRRGPRVLISRALHHTSLFTSCHTTTAVAVNRSLITSHFGDRTQRSLHRLYSQEEFKIFVDQKIEMFQEPKFRRNTLDLQHARHLAPHLTCTTIHETDIMAPFHSQGNGAQRSVK